MPRQKFLVGEISKSWINGEPISDIGLLSQQFEAMLECNHQRGYRLVTFHVVHTMVSVDQLNETLIAVFEAIDG